MAGAHWSTVDSGNRPFDQLLQRFEQTTIGNDDALQNIEQHRISPHYSHQPSMAHLPEPSVAPRRKPVGSAIEYSSHTDASREGIDCFDEPLIQSGSSSSKPALHRINSFEQGDDAFMRGVSQGNQQQFGDSTLHHSSMQLHSLEIPRNELHDGIASPHEHDFQAQQMWTTHPSIPQNPRIAFDASEFDRTPQRQAAVLSQEALAQHLPQRIATPQQLGPLPQPQSAEIATFDGRSYGSRQTSDGSYEVIDRSEIEPAPQPLHYHHQMFDDASQPRRSSDSPRSPSESLTTRAHTDLSRPPPIRFHDQSRLSPRSAHMPSEVQDGFRPVSTYSVASNPGAPRRNMSPSGLYSRTPSPSRHSPDMRISSTDLLNAPYPQPPPPIGNLNNSPLRTALGQNMTILDTKKTLEMYKDNIKKTNDPATQYEFAIFMINVAAEDLASGQQGFSKADRGSEGNALSSSADLLREARSILQKLADRSYPFAQYYLGDGYASGLFNKGVSDDERAFPLFVSASKHGHAEAGYRAALCYEYGWGCRRDLAKAVQFFRQSASKSHPGAMTRLGMACIRGELGFNAVTSQTISPKSGARAKATPHYREGLKWLKRGAEAADAQYNSAPYELGLLHETGFGPDVFLDTAYAAQLFTQSADLGHPEANYRLGDAYEHGKLSCPRDPALSVHFYTGAAQRGSHAAAMMALCAWYMVGAEPVLQKDEAEAYEWARKAAEAGLPKAEYAVGYFTEMGIGCRRDPLEANVWYVRAADHGDERARHRIAAIRAAASGYDEAAHAASANIPRKSRNTRAGSFGLGLDGQGGTSRRGSGEALGATGSANGTSGGKKKWGLF